MEQQESLPLGENAQCDVLCAQLAEYLDADITQHTLVEATAALRSAPWPTAPAELTARNPLAWLRALDQGAS